MTIHFIGICGTAMATLAALLKGKGHDVQGSDENVYPPMSTFLESEHIRTLRGYSADHITSERMHHGARLLRWRDDKLPQDCTMDQIR